jgi:CBS-domain-containing membrane protein
MLPESLITVEELRIHRAMLRGSGRFGSDTSAGDLVQTEVQSVLHTAALDEVFAILLRGQQQLVPVVDEQGHMVGLVGPQELARRAELRLAPQLLPLLTTEERASLLLPLASRPVAEVMTADWRGTTSATPVLQALMMMVEWNYDQLPVTSRDGRLAGLLSQQAVLQAALAASASTGNVRNADQPAPVQLVMQSHVPTLRHDQPLATALAQLLAAPRHYMVVVDESSHVAGEISLAWALRQLSGAARTALLVALQAERPVLSPFPGGDEPLDALLERDMVTVAPHDSINDATRRLAESGRSYAPVLDDGRLCGVVARGGLLRAFIQESA